MKLFVVITWSFWQSQNLYILQQDTVSKQLELTLTHVQNRKNLNTVLIFSDTLQISLAIQMTALV